MSESKKDETETVICKEHCRKHYHHGHSGGGDMVYCLGMIGAAVYFISHAVGFWAVVVAILKAFVWPAFFTYEIFQFLLK